MKELFARWISINRNRIINSFVDFLKINTITPNEADAYPFIKDYLNEIRFNVEKQFLHKGLKEHQSFTNHPLSYITPERFNIKARDRCKIGNRRKKVLFNIHFDVVPETEDFKSAFKPYLEDGFIYGRGACDTKNNLIMLVEAIRFLNDNNIKIQKEIEIDLVIEEEVSGSGTLSSIMHGIDADLVIDMEPTNLLLYRGHRGIITTTIDVKGKSVHMGSDETGVNAIECSFHIIESLKQLENEMLSEALENKDFSIWKKPLQINIGKIFGGEWPGSVPEKCTIVSNIGFLPNYTIDQIKSKIINTCKNTKNDWTNRNNVIVFNGLHNSAYIVNESDSNIGEIISTLNKYGINQSESFGWRVSCDAYLYYTLLNIPTFIFGSGDLNDAHSAHEKVNLSELELGMLVLADYLSKP